MPREINHLPNMRFLPEAEVSVMEVFFFLFYKLEV